MGRYYESWREFFQTAVLSPLLGASLGGSSIFLAILLVRATGSPRYLALPLVLMLLWMLLWPLRPQQWRRLGAPRRQRTLSRGREYAYALPQALGLLLCAGSIWWAAGSYPVPWKALVTIDALAGTLLVAPLFVMHLLEFERAD